MKKLMTAAVLTSACAFAATGLAIIERTGNATQVAGDEVVASFDRELERHPGPARPVTRKSIDRDVLYRMVNPVSWTKDSEELTSTNEADSDTSQEEK